MNLGEIREQVRRYLSKPELATLPFATIDIFVANAQRYIQRRYKFSFLQTTVSKQIVAGQTTMTLPADTQHIYAVWVHDDNAAVKLRRISREAMMEGYSSASWTGVPAEYTLFGEKTLCILPPPDGDYRVRVDYYRNLDILATAAATNAISEYAPDALVKGSVKEAYEYFRMYPDAQWWEAQRDKAIADLISEQARLATEDYEPRIRAGIGRYRSWFRW